MARMMGVFGYMTSRGELQGGMLNADAPTSDQTDLDGASTIIAQVDSRAGRSRSSLNVYRTVQFECRLILARSRYPVALRHIDESYMQVLLTIHTGPEKSQASGLVQITEALRLLKNVWMVDINYAWTQLFNVDTKSTGV
jgi:hypothetical protein